MNSLWSAQYAVASSLALSLLHSLWEVAVLSLLAAVTFRFLERHSAALRHSVGLGFMVSMLLAPAWTFAWCVHRPAAELKSGMLPVLSAPVHDESSGLFVQHSNYGAAALSLLWLLGVAVMLLRHVGGLRLIRNLEELPFEPLTPNWRARFDALRSSMGITRNVLVRLANHVSSPFTARLMRPVIWLPLALLTQLPVEQIEVLLAHELAHIRRMDWLWNGFQCAVESLLFYHPGVWWLSRRIRQERENACDDLAVAACGDAVALAEALAAMERGRPAYPHLALALAADGGSLVHRVTRLLSGQPSPSHWRVPIGFLMLLGTCSLLATQVDLSGRHSPGLQIESSSEGPLSPGNYRSVTAYDVMGARRHYTIRMDTSGRVVEAYDENDSARPITPAVRVWVADTNAVSTLAVLPLPPPPGAPLSPPPPAIPQLPVPPVPPVPPPL
jgi:beta-lactamase regulating signal transducer with metallopeptidase domain